MKLLFNQWLFAPVLLILKLITNPAALVSSGVAAHNVHGDINPLIASEDSEGIPYLQGPNHVKADGGFFNDARNIVLALWLINDSTWGAEGLAAETAIVIRATWSQQVVVSQVIAATKMGNMMDRFRKDNGMFDVPDYKLSTADLECLYDDHSELDRYRATASVTAMKRWIEYSYPESQWGSAAYDAREEFYEQLKCNGTECRTNPMFSMFGLENSYIIKYDEYDEESFFCTSVSPQEIGEKVAMQLNDYACKDGWNHCGHGSSSDHDTGMMMTGSYGPQAYSDTTGYHPVHHYKGPAPSKEEEYNHRWAPILETDGRGYYTRQEFVVPHIGATADTVYLSAKDREEIRQEFTMKGPYDNYKELARDALLRTAMIADDEKYKTLISWFDDKLKLAAATAEFMALNESRHWKLEDTAYYFQGYIMLEYDGIVANWRSKVENDHVRPTTVVQELLTGEMTENWMRGVDGRVSYPAEQWTPYIRVMPHGEYPSGSSCVCTAVMKWSAQALGVDYDEDFPIMYPHPMGSNKFEPTLPTEDFMAEYRSHKEVADTCAQTRVDGGMHFPEAIVAGDKMCGGELVFEKGVAFQKFIWTGDETFLEPWGGMEEFGDSPSKKCVYNPDQKTNKKGKKGKKGTRSKDTEAQPMSKFECMP